MTTRIPPGLANWTAYEVAEYLDFSDLGDAANDLYCILLNIQNQAETPNDLAMNWWKLLSDFQRQIIRDSYKEVAFSRAA